MYLLTLGFKEILMKMKKNLLVFFAIFLICLIIPVTATAQDDYFSWKIGTSQMDAENITGIGVYATETLNTTTVDDEVT